MELISKKEAKEKKLKRYYTGKPCKHGHVCERSVSKSQCLCCKKEQNAIYNKTEKGKIRLKRAKKKYRATEKGEIAVKKDLKLYQERHRDKLKIYYENYKEQNKETLLKRKREYYHNNKEELLKKGKIYRDSDHGQKIAKRNYLKRKEKIQNDPELKESQKNFYKEYQKARSKKDPVFKLINNFRHRIYMSLKRSKSNKSNKSIILLGCEVGILKKHLENQFSKGMKWENYGEWHVDHIIPCDYFVKNFDFNDESIQRICFNYRNLQPMWGEENQIKHKKIKENEAKNKILKIKELLKL